MKLLQTAARVVKKDTNTRTTARGMVTEHILTLSFGGCQMLKVVPDTDNLSSIKVGGTIVVPLYQLPSGQYHPSKSYADMIWKAHKAT
ncbi:MAG: hypothetical protein WCT49_02025 [Candidatus Paceibacterota bacterium]|nr:hypothetical protein [Candidatus Paceibacterota bacterium]